MLKRVHIGLCLACVAILLYIRYQSGYPAQPRHVPAKARRLSVQRPLFSRLNQYYQTLEHVRSRLTSVEYPWHTNDTKETVLNAYSQNFFEKLQTFSRVVSVFMRLPRAQLREAFPPAHVFDYSSNDCARMERVSIYGKQLGFTLFNSTCLPLSDIKPHVVSSVPLQLGLPKGYVHNEHHFILSYILVVKDALVTNTGDIRLPNAKIVIQRCMQNLKRKSLIKDVSRYTSYNEVFTISQFWGGGFYHGVVEDLTRIAIYIPFLRKHQDIKIHVASKSSFVRDIIEVLGMQTTRLVTGIMYAKTLYSPAGSPCGRSTLTGAHTLSALLRQNIVPPKGERDAIVLIKRSRKRFFRRHNDIHQMVQRVARERNLTVSVFADDPLPSFAETGRMFNKAVVILAPHGAGLANMLFSEPGTVIIEGLCFDATHRTNLCYRNLAQLLGHRYYGVMPEHQCLDMGPQDLERPLGQHLDMLSQFR